MAEFLRVQLVQTVNVIELSLPETIDALEFDRLNESMSGHITGKANQPWVLDLSGVDYLGSAMLGFIVNIRQQVKTAGGKLVLCSMSERLAEIFRTCSMERLFIIKKNRLESLASLQR